MIHPESMPRTVPEMLETLSRIRDNARLQGHLLSLDARKRWEAIEDSLRGVQVRLERSGGELSSATLDTFREATQAAKSLLEEVDGTTELTRSVRELMNSQPATCSPEDSLNRAVQLFWELDCGCVPVVDAERRVVGMITDRDVCMAAYTQGRPLADLTVESAMSKVVHCCSPEDTIGEAARVMAEKQVRRLPVVEDGKLAGMLSLADLTQHVQHHRGNRAPGWLALGHTIAAVSEPRNQRARAAE